MQKEELPSSLVREVAQRHCVLFLGPDAAETAGGYLGLPTSGQLAGELARLANYSQRYLSLPQIAQVYEHSHSRQELVSYLRERLGDPVYEPLPIHELIARIPFFAVVHAGWDGLLERALDKQSIAYRPVSVSDISYERENQDLLVYKLFGSLDKPDTLVITEDDQLKVLYELRALKRRLTDLMASNTLLMVGYAPDYDSVFVQVYHEIRQEQGEHRRPAFVVTSLQRPGDALQWAARGIEPLRTDPVAFLYELVLALTPGKDRNKLPDLTTISQAPAVTQEDLQEPTQVFNQVLEIAGIGELVEQTDVPLLSAAQVRDLEGMRAAYERLTQNLAPMADSAQVWLRLGNIEYSRQNYDSAQHYYQMALSAQPNMAEAYHNLHYLHLAQGNLKEALNSYLRAVEIKPELALLPPQYRVDAVLGRGGMGVVYRALDETTGQVVAIKLLDRAFLRTERVVARFKREADILKRLNHPHIVKYIDFQPYQGRLYIVMEYLGQETLADLLQQSGRLPLDEAYELFREICEAVIFAHQMHIIHRDIKPANIFRVNSGVKLIDFGLAADLEAGQPSIVGMATGTVAYMSPEQLAGNPVDERTDVYALATLLYEMVTGNHPGQGAYHPPGEIIPGLTDAFDIILQKARERSPQARYASVEAFLQEVGRIMPLQPASHQASPVRRLLARLDQGIDTFRPYLLIAAILPGLFISSMRLPGAGATVLRLGGLLLWDAFLLSYFADWFLVWLAKRSGFASISAYGSLAGSLLGTSIGILTIMAISRESFNFSGSMDWIDFTINLLVNSAMTVIIGGFSFLSAAAGSRLAIRLRLSPHLGAVLGLISMVALYALFLFGSSLFF